MRVLCLGDSNTYGYDPRSFFGGQYPPASRWVDILAGETGWTCINAGESGMEIPHRLYELLWLRRTLEDARPIDFLIIMLGGNDMLQGADAGETAARMEELLGRFSLSGENILLIAPPPMEEGEWITEARLLEESSRLGAEYEALARKVGVRFADAGKWRIPMTFDGVHFTEEGHRRFAAHLLHTLRDRIK